MEMKFTRKDPPREFKVGADQQIIIKDFGRMELAPDEQITFITDTNAEYDIARKSWGFYATPSLNGRLKAFGLRAVLVKNAQNKYFIMLVERGKEEDFRCYMKAENLTITFWMDCNEALEELERKTNNSGNRCSSQSLQ
jgi:hypothetical protein